MIGNIYIAVTQICAVDKRESAVTQTCAAYTDFDSNSNSRRIGDDGSIILCAEEEEENHSDGDIEVKGVPLNSPNTVHSKYIHSYL